MGNLKLGDLSGRMREEAERQLGKSAGLTVSIASILEQARDPDRPDDPARFWIHFRVDGSPKGQPRPRRSKSGGVYNPATANGWKRAVEIAARPHLPPSPLIGPVCVDLDLLLPRPQRLYRKRGPAGEVPATCKPDRDNVDKATLDALTAVGMWRDDAQVCDGRIRKLYHAVGGKPGARITVSLITASPAIPGVTGGVSAAVHRNRTAATGPSFRGRRPAQQD